MATKSVTPTKKYHLIWNDPKDGRLIKSGFEYSDNQYCLSLKFDADTWENIDHMAINETRFYFSETIGDSAVIIRYE